MELIYSNGRLWIMSCGLPRSQTDIKSLAVAEECLAAALESCQNAVSRLRASRFFWYMPNTVGPMLAYAGVLSLHLFESSPAYKSVSSQAHLFGLLANLALLLEKVGTTPSHRFGTAMVYGQHLKVIIRRKIYALWNQVNETPLPSGEKFDPTLQSQLFHHNNNSDIKGLEFSLTKEQHETSSKHTRGVPFGLSGNNSNPTGTDYPDSISSSPTGSATAQWSRYSENMFLGHSGTGAGWGNDVRNMLEVLGPLGEGQM